MHGYVDYDNDADDISWNDEIPFRGESPVRHPGDYVRTELTPAEMLEMDPDNEYHAVGDSCFIGGYVPKDGEDGMLSVAVNGETIDNFITWRELPNSIRGHLR